MDASSQATRASGHKDRAPPAQFKQVLWPGRASVRERLRAERQSTQTFGLVAAALSVTGAHQRTIEPFISIILISPSVLDWSIAGRECQRFG
jgi:hypothetical protein